MKEHINYNLNTQKSGKRTQEKNQKQREIISEINISLESTQGK